MVCDWKKMMIFMAAIGLLAAGVGFAVKTRDVLRIWSKPAREPIRGIADNICGPRCVQFVLQHYGIDAELQDLVREMQWPELEKGATLDSMSQALERRGVHTCVLKVDPSTRLAWRDPVIVHLQGAKEALGHYLVLLPGAASGEVDEYVEFTNVNHYPADAIRERMSGVVMLTSSKPIDDWRSAMPEGRMSLSLTRLVLLVSSSLGILLLIRFGPRLRGRSLSLPIFFRRRLP